MKRIAILTHPLAGNYGGVLQCYALSKYLERNGCSVIVLNRHQNISPAIKRIVIKILRHVGCKRYSDNSPRSLDIRSFVQKNINYTKPIESDRELIRYMKRIDTVIVGSDQVWRKSFAKDYGYNYFLDFVPSCTKRIAYAASFGLSSWDYSEEETRIIQDLLKKFTCISVRESSGVKLCEKYLNISVPELIDPTLLLDENDYIINKEGNATEDSFIFAYWLGDEKDLDRELYELQKQCPYKIKSIILRSSSSTSSVEDWLESIKDAAIVITDSFHGCVFSILFKKKFVACENSSGGNTRILSLFSKLGIDPKRTAYMTEDDYSPIFEKIHEERILVESFFSAIK